MPGIPGVAGEPTRPIDQLSKTGATRMAALETTKSPKPSVSTKPWLALPMVVVGVLWVLGVAGLAYLDSLEEQWSADQERQQITKRAEGIRDCLVAELREPMSSSRGLIAQIVVDGDIGEARFHRIAKILLNENLNVRSLTLARGTVIAMVHPLAGNERALGVDYRSVPAQWQVVERTIEERRPILQGPIPLIQGGEGLVLRYPVFLPSPTGGEPHFFGLVSVVLDVAGILAGCDANRGYRDIDITIRGRDGLGDLGETFFGRDAILGRQPVKLEVPFSYGKWLLMAAPPRGWTSDNDGLQRFRMLEGMILLLLTAVLVGIAAWIATARRANARLEERNRELNVQSLALAHATRRAEEADRIKGEFISNMSHEFRTPLNAIIGFSSTILEHDRDIIDNRIRNNIDHIFVAGNHLLDMVSNVLDIAKVESGSFETRPAVVNLGRITEECLEIVEYLLESKSITLGADIVPSCWSFCDPGRTRQAILNILSNAIKYSPEATHLSVRVARLDTEQGCLIEIADQGVGMTDDELQIALTQFGQIRSDLCAGYGGTGLGLPLARRLVEVQGGKFNIRSKKGTGTTVQLILPAVDTDAGAGEHHAVSAGA